MNEADAPSLRQQKKQQARRSILDAAGTLIAARGYDETKMRDIASSAGISYQTLYNYFPTKGQILRALLTEQLTDVSRQFEDVLQSYEGGLLEALDAMNAISFQLVVGSDRHLWRIVMIDLFDQKDDTTQIFELIENVFHELLERLLIEARDAGELIPDVSVAGLSEVLFDLADHHLLRFVLNPAATLDTTLAKLGAQTRVVVSPYLTQVL